MLRATTGDTISLAEAREIDAAWIAGGRTPSRGLRIVRHYGPLGQDKFLLEVPGDDTAPVYMRYDDHFVHLGGPTLAEWQEVQEAAEASREARELYEWASGR